MKLPVIGFVGMSHLGLNYAVATASKKFKVQRSRTRRNKKSSTAHRSGEGSLQKV